jgi:hypothetical protein
LDIELWGAQLVEDVLSHNVRKKRMALPLAEQFLLDLVAPPVIAGVWGLSSRRWAAGVQGGQVSDRTKKRQKVEFAILLALAYFLLFGITIQKNFFK